ncbi:MAG: alpha-galactosidase [Bryobacterales bacterium]|nr:alpha-galactosidase [Bryobacterales bacterium]
MVMLILLVLECLLALSPGAAAEIAVREGRAVLRAESLERIIQIDGNVSTVGFSVDGTGILAERAKEFSVVITREESNRKPRGLRPEEAGEKNYFSGGGRARWRAEGFDPARYEDLRPDAPRWVDPRTVEAGSWSGSAAAKPVAAITRPAAGVTRLTVRTALDKDPALAGVTIELVYEVYDGHPAVRKWAVVRNGGTRWLRLERMMIDDVRLTPLASKSLAAAMFGVQPSVVGFEGPGGRYGILAASEVPSALRSIAAQGGMGYTETLFEWVLGPGEVFTSEPVFYYGFHGPVFGANASTPLDRAVEGQYMEFLRTRIGIAADTAPMHGPQWMTWAYFYDTIDDGLVRQLADIAARAGFTEMLFDDGWQKGRLGTEIDTKKFPDFRATADFVRSKGLKLGLWVSCFRDADSRDVADMPDARILPVLLRSPTLPGMGMSFTSAAWRDYYVRDLVATAKRYGASYFKQDFTNIMYGDLAEGHESRTRRESLLRGLRGLLSVQAMLRREAPDVVNEITHEIYWGTPGVPADLAALKTTARFHIPPNEAIGSNVRENGGRPWTAETHAAALRRGCWLARQRFYSHRGLPLYPLEFYAAVTASYQGSLTPAIQDRQIASWLMGMPVCYSGDSRTLSEEQIAHYRKRLDLVRRLERDYGIYKRFQFSGAPEPTDVGWHWWGKLNPQGYGVVVAMRGSGGADRQTVTIPWVRPERSYHVKGLLSGVMYGSFAGKVLQESGIPVRLPVYGQELLELAP